jgi:hypothetical protein
MNNRGGTPFLGSPSRCKISAHPSHFSVPTRLGLPTLQVFASWSLGCGASPGPWNLEIPSDLFRISNFVIRIFPHPCPSVLIRGSFASLCDLCVESPHSTFPSTTPSFHSRKCCNLAQKCCDLDLKNHSVLPTLLQRCDL